MIYEPCNPQAVLASIIEDAEINYERRLYTPDETTEEYTEESDDEYIELWWAF